VANLFLFSLFHKYLSFFDRHIRKQNQTVESLPLDFGRALEAELGQFGFSRKETGQYIGLFFQMRRAFYFINTRLVGARPCMENLRAHLWNTVFTQDIGEYARNLVNKLEDFSTLLLGETGTGKGLAAAAIGRSGFIPYNIKTNRFAVSFTQAFLSINLCQFSEQLIESELFGHARGAFTGAVTDHQGIFSRSSSHGAVFLDEIGEVSVQAQIKLLRILQERVFTPVGSHAAHRFEGRLIGATNRNLEKLMEQGKFREDFYFRLCTDIITLPPLRQRIAETAKELDLLAVHLIDKIAGRPVKKLRQTVLAALHSRENRDYHWPGNVRELEQVIRRILLHGTCRLINSHIRTDELRDLMLKKQPSVAELTSRYCRILFQQHHTLQAVARITGLDRRTVKKYIEQGR
jgi:transcriptional regulator with GAF, ATPase, and Fis domain